MRGFCCVEKGPRILGNTGKPELLETTRTKARSVKIYFHIFVFVFSKFRLTHGISFSKYKYIFLKYKKLIPQLLRNKIFVFLKHVVVFCLLSYKCLERIQNLYVLGARANYSSNRNTPYTGIVEQKYSVYGYLLRVITSTTVHNTYYSRISIVWIYIKAKTCVSNKDI